MDTPGPTPSPLAFGTAGIRARVGDGPGELSVAVARRLGRALATHVGPGATVVVGRDGRASSPALADAVVAGLVAGGVAVVRFRDPVPTPLLAFAVRELAGAAAVMVTASHNPADENGLKVFGADGAQIVSPLDRALAAALTGDEPPPAPHAGTVVTVPDAVTDPLPRIATSSDG